MDRLDTHLVSPVPPVARLSCRTSPGQQIFNPFDPHHRHEMPYAFFIVGKVIDKRFLGE